MTLMSPLYTKAGLPETFCPPASAHPSLQAKECGSKILEHLSNLEKTFNSDLFLLDLKLFFMVFKIKT